jgi:hypothetical protein
LCVRRWHRLAAAAVWPQPARLMGGRLSAPPSPPSHARSGPVLVRLADMLRAARLEQPEPAWDDPIPRPRPTPPDATPPDATPPDATPLSATPPRPTPPTRAEAVVVATRVARPLVEVLAGRRPMRQLRGVLGPKAQVLLETMQSRAARRRNRGLRLLTVRVCVPHAEAIEAAVIMQGPDHRVRAMAIRLEHQRGRWLCMTLQLG